MNPAFAVGARSPAAPLAVPVDAAPAGSTSGSTRGLGPPAPPPQTAAPDDPQAFGEWVTPYWRGMALLAARSVPGEWEDLLQDAFANAWRKRRQFDPHRGSARNWLLAIVADQIARHRRRRIPAPTPPPDDIAALAGDHDSRIDLNAAMQTLTERQRAAVTLHYLLGLPVADIAEVLGCAAGTVKSTLSDARRLLRRQLEGESS